METPSETQSPPATKKELPPDSIYRRKIGALWVKSKTNGEKFLTGDLHIEGKKIGIIVFKDNFKKVDKHPDYEIFTSQAEGSAAKDLLD